MHRFIFTILFCLSMACSLQAQSTPIHNITAAPGKPWHMVVQFKATAGFPAERHGNYYMAVVRSDGLLSSDLYARMSVEASSVNPSALLLSMTAEQVQAITGKPATWQLVYIPDTGPAILLTTGRFEVTP